MTTTQTTTDPMTRPTDAQLEGNRHRKHRASLAAGFAMLLAAILTAGLFASPAATAATPPTTYSNAHNACTTITNGSSRTSYLYTGRPVAAANYAGTTYLYWDAQVEILTAGKWYVVGTYLGTYAHIWGHSGTELSPIYWNDTPNNYGVGLPALTGYSYRVIGQTYWWNGSTWFTSSQSLIVQCNF